MFAAASVLVCLVGHTPSRGTPFGSVRRVRAPPLKTSNMHARGSFFIHGSTPRTELRFRLLSLGRGARGVAWRRP